MSDEKKSPNPPKKPMGRWNAAAAGVLGGAVVGAVIEAGIQKFFYKRAKLNIDKVAANALDIGVIVGLVEFFTTKEKHNTHDVKVENVDLHHQVADLEEQLSHTKHSKHAKHSKPHVDQLAEQSQESQEPQ